MALVMNIIRGLQHNVTGQSVHNQRIERLWRDVHKDVTQLIYMELYSLEDEGVLDADTPVAPLNVKIPLNVKTPLNVKNLR